MRYLRQSTATSVGMGPFLAKADGLTPLTALASQAGRLIKNGTGSALSAPGTWTHDGNGHYLIGLGTGDTDTLGRLRITFSDPATFCPVWEDFSVLSAAVYDWLFGTVAPSTYTGADTAGTTTLLTRIPGTVQPQTGDAYARLGVPTGVSISADLVTIGGFAETTNTLVTSIHSRLPAAMVGGRLDVSVGAYQTGLTPLQPTIAGRTIDINATGEAGIDWANIGGTATAVNLSGTTVGTITSYTGDTPQTGDSFARIGATGSGLTSLAPASTALSTATWTTTLATKITNMPVIANGTALGGDTASTFRITGAGLNATNNAYVGQQICFQSGNLITERRSVTAHTVTGSGPTATHTITVGSPFTSAPASSDTCTLP